MAVLDNAHDIRRAYDVTMTLADDFVRCRCVGIHHPVTIVTGQYKLW